jgi:hypothetical protein
VLLVVVFACSVDLLSEFDLVFFVCAGVPKADRLMTELVVASVLLLCVLELFVLLLFELPPKFMLITLAKAMLGKIMLTAIRSFLFIEVSCFVMSFKRCNE